jgi:hypothetical protein
LAPSPPLQEGILVNVAPRRFRDWFRPSSEIIRRQEDTAAHPVRTSLFIGTVAGAAIGWAFISRTLVGVAIGVIAGNLIFGPLVVLEARRRVNRRRRRDERR